MFRRRKKKKNRIRNSPNKRKSRWLKRAKSRRNRLPAKSRARNSKKEHGKLLYSFDIRNDKGTITEVQVDAKTGKVLSAKEESKEDEEKEKREDEKAAKKKSKKS